MNGTGRKTKNAALIPESFRLGAAKKYTGYARKGINGLLPFAIEWGEEQIAHTALTRKFCPDKTTYNRNARI